MKKLVLSAALLAVMVLANYAGAEETAPRKCLTTVPMTTYWTQVICPNTANQAEVEKRGTFTLTLAADCPPTGAAGSIVTYGGWLGGSQSSGGGVPGKSPTPIATQECFGPNCTGQVCELNKHCSGSSVILSNGTYEFTETDLKVPARSIPVEWKRTYRSNRVLHSGSGLVFGELLDTPLGFGWTNDYFSNIANGDTYIDGEGRYFTFKKDASGNYISDAENNLTFKKTATGFEVNERGGLTRVFDSAGKLKEIKNQIGKTVTLAYGLDGKLTSIKDVSNRQVLSFSYENNRISAVTDLAGRSVNYSYDGFGNLVTASDPASNTRNYTYNAYHGITTKSNQLGETYTVEYLHQDKGVTGRVLDPVGTSKLLQGLPTAGYESVYQYDFANKTSYITGKNGSQIIRTINEAGKITSETEASTGTVLRNVEYLPNRTEIHTDRAGNKITFQKDDWGNVIRQSDGEGNETVTSYNPQNKPAAVTDPAGVVTNFEYDTTGIYLTKEIQASGKPEQVIIDYSYTPFGELQSKTSGGATTSYTYNDFGLPATITDPLGNVTSFEYDQYGHVAASIDASGNRSEFTYDILGNLLESKDPLGNRTTYTYNALGRLTSIKDALNRTTQYETDFKGRLTAIIDPLNNRKEYDYDGSGNLIKMTEGTAVTEFTYDTSDRLTFLKDAEGNITTYEYTVASSGCTSCGGGNSSSPSKIIDPFNNQTQYLFDKNGRVKSITDPLGKLTSLAYDAGGRISRRTDANGNIINYEYDALGRVKKEIYVNTVNQNKEILFSYDNRGNLMSLTDPRGYTTNFEYDLADRKTKEINPLQQFTEYTYYPNNLLKTVKDAKGQISTYNFDDSGRLIKIVYGDLKEDNFEYDKVGNLKIYRNEHEVGSIDYDDLNRKLSETINYGSFSKTYQYKYDDRGNKATYTSPEGLVYSYAYRLNNQLSNISFGTNTVQFEYLKNRHIKTNFPNGFTTDYGYNDNSWLTGITTKQGVTTITDYQYGFDEIGNITSKSTEYENYSYSYDTSYQLTNAVNSSLQESFSFDHSGNRSSDSTITTNLSFGTTEYHYNTRNRLETVSLPDGRTATYAYDPFGRRIKKEVAGQVTYYAYSDEGLIGEYDQLGNPQKAYVWKPNGMWGTDPIFMVESGNYYFYHNDQLGTPQMLTDINGNTVWSADYTVFGKAQIQTAIIENNLRFPGQYYDEETGLHYNWNRYYDPNTGRYTQEDPIGFNSGDINHYFYTRNNSLNKIDPYGLMARVPITPFTPYPPKPIPGLPDNCVLLNFEMFEKDLGRRIEIVDTLGKNLWNVFRFAVGVGTEAKYEINVWRTFYRLLFECTKPCGEKYRFSTELDTNIDRFEQIHMWIRTYHSVLTIRFYTKWEKIF